MTVQRVAVVGAGVMGRGIAHVAAAAGFSVALHDVQPGQLESALATIRRNMDEAVERGKMSATERDEALSRIRTTTSSSKRCSSKWS
jgi:3-hydroxybutyryl-CoA dehydrogenase